MLFSPKVETLIRLYQAIVRCAPSDFEKELLDGVSQSRRGFWTDLVGKGNDIAVRNSVLYEFGYFCDIQVEVSMELEEKEVVIS